MGGGSMVSRSGMVSRGGVLGRRSLLVVVSIVIVVRPAPGGTSIVREGPINGDDSRTDICEMLEQADGQVKTPRTVVGASNTRVDDDRVGCLATVRNNNRTIAVWAIASVPERILRERDDVVRVGVRLAASSDSQVVPRRANPIMFISSLRQVSPLMVFSQSMVMRAPHIDRSM